MTTRHHALQPLPMLLHDALSEGGIKEVDQWWERQDDTSRSDLIELWESCADRFFGENREEEEPMRLRVVATPADPASDTYEGFWSHDLYDYLVSHEAYYLGQKTFHVCTAQCAARRAVERGVIPHDFHCPVADSSCLMKGALQLSGGATIRLGVTFVPRDPTETPATVL